METTKPYTKLAEIYDRLMDHVDYIHWGDYILDLIDHSGGEVGSLIDFSHEEANSRLGRIHFLCTKL
jgi:hypothetical protein